MIYREMAYREMRQRWPARGQVAYRGPRLGYDPSAEYEPFGDIGRDEAPQGGREYQRRYRQPEPSGFAQYESGFATEGYAEELYGDQFEFTVDIPHTRAYGPLEYERGYGPAIQGDEDFGYGLTGYGSMYQPLYGGEGYGSRAEFGYGTVDFGGRGFETGFEGRGYSRRAEPGPGRLEPVFRDFDTERGATGYFSEPGFGSEFQPARRTSERSYEYTIGPRTAGRMAGRRLSEDFDEIQLQRKIRIRQRGI